MAATYFISIFLLAFVAVALAGFGGDGSCNADINGGFLFRANASCTATCLTGRWTIPCFIDFGTACNNVCNFSNDKLDFAMGFTTNAASDMYLTIDPNGDESKGGQLISSSGATFLDGMVRLHLTPGLTAPPGAKVYYFFTKEGSATFTGKFSIQAPSWRATIPCYAGGSALSQTNAQGQYADFSVLDTCSDGSSMVLGGLGFLITLSSLL
jgi:hypothetical protein